MPINEAQLRSLFNKFAVNDCTREELQELYGYYKESGDAQLHALMDTWYQQMPDSPAAEKVDWDHMFAGIVAHEALPVIKRTPVLFTIRRIAAAAIVVLLLGSSWWYFFHHTNPGTSAGSPGKILAVNIAPGSNKAMLTLANGQQISLDNAANGVLAQEGNTKVVKTDSGRLSYLP